MATGRIEKTQPNIFSADEGTDIGLDEGTAVSSSYPVPFRFTGKIHKVIVELKPATTATTSEEEKRRKEAALKVEL